MVFIIKFTNTLLGGSQGRFHVLEIFGLLLSIDLVIKNHSS